MNHYTSNSTLCCHWCRIPLGNASQVTYLNRNLPICDRCLSNKATPTEPQYYTGRCLKIVYR
jgi:hypothetical protein